MRHKWSEHDRAQVKRLTDALCKNLGISGLDADYQSIGWEGFLTVYRNDPGAFLNAGKRGWKNAAELIDRRLREEKAARERLFYQSVSLDAPVSEETNITRLQIFPGKQGDFQNSVCFRDYLEGLDDWSHDAKELAFALANGDSPEETRQELCWDQARMDQAMEIVRLAMTEYLEL